MKNGMLNKDVGGSLSALFEIRFPEGLFYPEPFASE